MKAMLPPPPPPPPPPLSMGRGISDCALGTVQTSREEGLFVLPPPCSFTGEEEEGGGFFLGARGPYLEMRAFALHQKEKEKM